MNELTSTLGTSDPSVEQAGRSRLTGESRPALEPSPRHTPRPAGYLAFGPLLHGLNRECVCLECAKPFVTVTPLQVRCSEKCAKAWATRYKKRANARRHKIKARIAERGTKADMRIPDRRRA